MNINGENTTQKTIPKKKWIGSYVIAGLTWTLAQNFKKTTVDELVILVVALGAGFLYYRLKSKINIKNEIIKIIITFVIIEIIAAFLVGFLTTIV